MKKLENGERIEDLQCGGLKIIQNENLYTFTSDSVILANFVDVKKNDLAVEIGAGSGVISILVQAKTNVKHITAFEIQKEMADLCRKNIDLNDLQEKIEIVCDDVKNYQKHIKKASFDVVFCNPPYFKPTNFAQNKVKQIAKEEGKLSCDDLCKVASEILKDGGNFYVCYAAERAAELFFCLQKYSLAVKEFFFTQNGKGKFTIVVARATKGGKFGAKVLPILVTNEADGTYKSALHTKNALHDFAQKAGKDCSDK